MTTKLFILWQDVVAANNNIYNIYEDVNVANEVLTDLTTQCFNEEIKYGRDDNEVIFQTPEQIQDYCNRKYIIEETQTV